MKKFLSYITLFLPTTLLAVPAIVRAQPSTFSGIVCIIIDVLDFVIIALGSFAFIVFLWGLVQYTFNAGSEKSRARGKFILTWGIISLAVLTSVWGILRFLYGEFGFTEPFGTFLLRTGGGGTGSGC